MGYDYFFDQIMLEFTKLGITQRFNLNIGHDATMIVKNQHKSIRRFRQAT